MAKKTTPKERQEGLAQDLWINPRSNLKGPDGNRAWNNAGNISPQSGARFLELADIALGIKKPVPRHKKAAAAAAGSHR